MNGIESGPGGRRGRLRAVTNRATRMPIGKLIASAEPHESDNGKATTSLILSIKLVSTN